MFHKKLTDRLLKATFTRISLIKLRHHLKALSPSHSMQDGAGGDEAAEDDDGPKKVVHADADTFLLFTKPRQISAGAVELPGGQPVEFLVGFR